MGETHFRRYVQWMHPTRDLHIAAFMTAATLTIVSVVWDGASSRSHLRNEALALSRQVAAQAQGLALQARERGIEEDPIHWAVALLSQSPEPRLVVLHDFQGFAGGATTEASHLNSRDGIFEYTRTLTPEDGKGIRIQVRTGYRGFLGTRHLLTNDLMIAIFLGAFYVFAWFLGRKYFHGLAPTQSKQEPNLRHWLSQAKALLTELAISIRETVRQSQKIAAIAGRARVKVNELNQMIEKELTTAKQGTDERHLLIGLRQKSLSASRSFDEFFKETKTLSSHISHTTDTLLLNSRHIQELSQAITPVEMETKPKFFGIRTSRRARRSPLSAERPESEPAIHTPGEPDRDDDSENAA